MAEVQARLADPTTRARIKGCRKPSGGWCPMGSGTRSCRCRTWILWDLRPLKSAPSMGRSL